MSKYLLLLNHAPDRYTRLDADERLSILKDYVAWVEEMTERGVYVAGYKLTESARRLTANGKGVEVHDSPLAELSEVLGGFMMIHAENYDAAVALTRSHPHLVHNHYIEIREVEEPGD